MTTIRIQFHFTKRAWYNTSTMKVDILTLFPDMFNGPFSNSILRRAQDKSLVAINIHDLRHWSTDKHKSVDDHPYGGGVGMLMMVEPIYRALRELKDQNSKVILMDPGGTPFNQAKAQELSQLNHVILIAGHYEGVDARVRENLIDEEISIGDYVLTGGELPAMVVVDSIVRLIPGVLEKPEATQIESFSENLLEFPQYTRPEEFNGWGVPEVLLSGNHKKIEQWRKQKAVEKTRKVRPNLLKV